MSSLQKILDGVIFFGGDVVVPVDPVGGDVVVPVDPVEDDVVVLPVDPEVVGGDVVVVLFNLSSDGGFLDGELVKNTIDITIDKIMTQQTTPIMTYLYLLRLSVREPDSDGGADGADGGADSDADGADGVGCWYIPCAAYGL